MSVCASVILAVCHVSLSVVRYNGWKNCLYVKRCILFMYIVRLSASAHLAPKSPEVLFLRYQNYSGAPLQRNRYYVMPVYKEWN